MTLCTLTHVKSKVVFGLTNRQLICFSGALVIGVPLYFLTRDYISNSAAAPAHGICHAAGLFACTMSDLCYT